MIVSIIIPAYNAERFIDRCLLSVYKTAPDEDWFEVIVVNDGSKDNTVELVESNWAIHSNLILINKVNEGVSVARNTGIEAAHGDYVLFLDADDELADGSLKKVCDYLSERGPMDMLMTRQLQYNGEREWLVEGPHLEEHKIYDGVEAFKAGFVRINAGGGICNRSFLKEYGIMFPAGVRNAEDTVFFGQSQVYAKSIVYYNFPLYRINEVAESASRNPDYTKLGKSHVVTLRAAAAVKKSLNAGKGQKAIFDYVVYQLLSNTTGHFVDSEELSFSQLKKNVDLKSLLPLDTGNMYILRRKAQLMNFCYPLFYFLTWLNQKVFN